MWGIGPKGKIGVAMVFPHDEVIEHEVLKSCAWVYVCGDHLYWRKGHVGK
jgi:hypothetical protein